MEWGNMWLFVAGVFHWVYVFTSHPCWHLCQPLIPFYGRIIFHWMDRPHLFTHSSADESSGCFHFSVIANSAAMHMHVYVFVWVPVFHFFWYVLRCRVAGLYGNSMTQFLRNHHQTVFYSGCTIYTTPLTMYEGFNFSTSLPTLTFCFFPI